MKPTTQGSLSPNSYALAITNESVTPYRLPAKNVIESDSSLYRKEIRSQRADVALAGRLFTELLNPIKEYSQKTGLIIVPDGITLSDALHSAGR
jgi:hypothetical protein